MSHMHDIADASSLAARIASAHTLSPSPPGDEWTRRYEDHWTFHLSRDEPVWGPVGELSVSRRLLSDGEQELKFEQWRNALAGYRSVTRATVQARVDALATPIAWRVETFIEHHGRGDIVPGTSLTKELEFDGEDLIERAPGSATRRKAPGPLALKYGLLEALGRSGGAVSAAPGEFVMLDEYDEMLSGQSIASLEFDPVRTAGGERVARGWRHTGQGTVPGTYWIDGSGRLLFYLAGAQALVLVEDNGTKAHHLFPDKELGA